LFILCLLPVCLAALPVRSDQLDATVELYTELLPFEKRDRLENLQIELEEYFRDEEWIEDYEGAPIPFTFRMYLVDESVGFEDRYGARIHASNDYDLQYLDKDCHFAYQFDERLEHDAVIYHSLTGLLDYYAYLIIGGEMDKRSTLGGDPYFKRAQEVIQEALFSEFYRGWNRRSDELERIIAEENTDYRKMLAVYFRALLLWEDERVEEAREYCRSALSMIARILQDDERVDEEWARYREEQITRFFTHHYREIGELFTGSPQAVEILALLVELDPDHEEIYRDFLGSS
jgi:hypothetical protein